MKNFMCNVDMFFKKIVQSFLIFIITSIAIIIALQVFMRYILHIPVHWCDEILTFSAVWLYMIGALAASIHEKHINARILEVFSKKIRYRSALRLISASISILISGWLAYWAYDFMIYAINKNKISLILGYHLYLYESAVFIAIFPMFIYSLVETYRYLMIFITNDNMGVEL